jgi:hypothetical protein
MSKTTSASDAKNDFDGLPEDVAALGRVNVMKHGRFVSVVLSPRALESSLAAGITEEQDGRWGETRMIRPELARTAHMLNLPSTFDEE